MNRDEVSYDGTCQEMNDGEVMVFIVGRSC